MRSDGTVAPEASSAARRLSGLGGPVVLCARARSDEEEAAVRAALKEAGVFAEEDGLESHVCFDVLSYLCIYFRVNYLFLHM